ncbi:MAG TPA: AraC family transcriptional regulator [Polyangia bacterium]|nr:AraC family transcriptional regulator [Polyangia bacterium]
MVDDVPAKPRYQRHPQLGIETVAYRGPLERMPTHAHAQYQLTLYDGGPRRFRVAGHDFGGAPRTAVIIQSGEPHGSVPVADPRVTLRTFYLDERLVAEVAASLWRGTGTVAFRAPVIEDAGTVARLLAAHRALDRGDHTAEERAYFALCDLLQRQASPTGSPLAPGASEEGLAAARALLADHLTGNVGLAQLAAAAGLSRFHLIRAFQRRYGLTPFAYQRNLRIERARAVLRAGVSLADAAANAGFSDQSHLGRSFRAVMGSTPGEYRASYRAAPR